MSALELALQKVKTLNEPQAILLIEWLQTVQPIPGEAPAPLGARAMLGYARRFRAEGRSSADWMAELRSGENP